MRSPTFLIAMLAAAAQAIQVANIYIQPINDANTVPTPFAEVHYDIAAPSEAKVASYEPPEIPEDTKLVRIGVYNSASSRWLSSTSVASVENFSQGYAPNIVLAVDQRGYILGATCKGVRVDAGQTRDFGPQAVVSVAATGKVPELNKPIVLSPGGKKVVEEEKTFLQKYWWILAAAVLLMMTSGGDGK